MLNNRDIYIDSNFILQCAKDLEDSPDLGVSSMININIVIQHLVLSEALENEFSCRKIWKVIKENDLITYEKLTFKNKLLMILEWLELPLIFYKEEALVFIYIEFFKAKVFLLEELKQK